MEYSKRLINVGAFLQPLLIIYLIHQHICHYISWYLLPPETIFAKSLNISFLYNSYWVLSCISWEIRWTFLGIQHFRLKDLKVISSQKSYKEIWSYLLLIYSLIHLLLTFICLDSIYLANGDLLIHLACTQYALNTLMKWSIQTEIWHGLFGIKK